MTIEQYLTFTVLALAFLQVTLPPLFKDRGSPSSAPERRSFYTTMVLGSLTFLAGVALFAFKTNSDERLRIETRKQARADMHADDALVIADQQNRINHLQQIVDTHADEQKQEATLQLQTTISQANSVLGEARKTGAGVNQALSRLTTILSGTDRVEKLALRNDSTASRLEQQNRENKEQSDKALCEDVLRVREDKRIIGLGGFRMSLYRAYRSKDPVFIKEIQERADQFLVSTLQPELRQLTVRLRVRLGITGPLPPGYLRNLLDADQFEPDAVGRALNELVTLKERVCPAQPFAARPETKPN